MHTSMQVVWVSYQIIQSTSWNLNIQFPAPYSSLLRILAIFSLDFFNVDCFSGQVPMIYSKIGNLVPCEDPAK